jgi:TonB family protein
MPFARTIRADRNRAAHPFAHFAKGWGIARSASALLLLAGTSLLRAQSPPCGLTSMTEQTQLIYPPIARAAHIGGTVILLVRFAQNGSVTDARMLSGPPMLRGSALNFVKDWRANEYSGPRECPIVVSFNVIESAGPVCAPQESGPDKFVRSDTQHVSISVHPLWICDPAGTVTKTRKRWF